MAKEVSSWRGIPARNPDAQGGIKSTGHGKFLGKNKRLFKKILLLKMFFKRL